MADLPREVGAGDRADALGMDALDLVTWIVAGLACIFLLVGIVLVVLLIIGYHRKNYQRVFEASAEEGQVEDSKPRYSQISYERERREPDRQAQPDMDAVLELRRSIQLNSYARRSKSALDISDGRRKFSRDEVEFPLLARQKEEEMVSQYFDAQETLDDVDDSEEDYEDLADDKFDEKEELRAGRARRRSRRGKASYSKDEKKKINALKILLLQQKQLEGEFHRELFLLESQYDEEKSTVYDKRREIVEGEGDKADSNQELSGIPGFWLQVLMNSRNLRHIVQTTDMSALENLMDISVMNLPHQNGFRLTFTFKENEWFKNLVLTKDYLINFKPPADASFINYEGPEVVQCTGSKVQWYRHKNLTIRPVKKVQNHKIVTKFARKNSFFNFFNPPSLPPEDDPAFSRKRELLEAHIQIGLFFKEYLIPKAYLFYTQPDYDKNIEKGISGRKIHRTKSSNCATPRPRRLSGEVEICWRLSSSKIDTPSARKLSTSTHLAQEAKRRLSTSQSSLKSNRTSASKLSNTTAGTARTGGQAAGTAVTNGAAGIGDGAAKIAANGISASKTSLQSRPTEKDKSSSSSRDINDNKNRKSLEESNAEKADQQLEENQNEICSGVDELVGKYRMESSEKFDDFMRALGVGMVRRKLAGSVVPVNVIEIDDNDTYTIRTLTNVRNSEITFRLGEPFVEDTLDGRKANTTATRKGNLLTLTQRGNPGEKDTLMTREVKGDTMHMELIVDDIVCTRVYKRILDE